MFRLPISIRSAFDHLRFSQRQRETPDLWTGQTQIFDSTSMPVELELPARLYERGEIESVLTVHVTDVLGGFGIADYQVKRWRRLLEQGKVPHELLAQLPDPTDLGGSSFILALLERYSGAAYHVIGSRRIGAVINHPVTLRTSHGGVGNMGLGWALDADNTEPLSAELVSIGRASLRYLVLKLHELTGKLVILVPHRVWSSGRREDPGKIVWMAIVRPVVDELGATIVEIGYNTKASSGAYITTEWDDRAHYDKRLKPVQRTSLAA